MTSIRWTLKKSVSVVIFSVFMTSLFAVSVRTFWLKKRKERSLDPKYHIHTIVQTGIEKEALKTSYLAELLSLSRDRPVSLYTFQTEIAESQLLQSPLICEAKVRKVFPDRICIDYEVRRPIAKIADYENVAIDTDRFLFPLAPFFSPKEIPEIYLGLPDFHAPPDSLGRSGGKWLEPLENPFIDLAFEILHFLERVQQREGMKIKRIDVSNAFAPTLGLREIVLITEEEFLLPQGGVANFPKILRLSPKDYPQQLASFFLLRRRMEADYRRQCASLQTSMRFSPRIVDLRISHLAFVENSL